ncbi:MAG TPA: hypothetical protein VIO87_00875 [Methylotenera sp.]
MDKNSNLPTEKAENPESPKAASTVPVESAKKIIDLNKPVIKEAVTKGKALIKDGKSKVEAAMLIFEALKDEDSEVIVAAFVQGAALTEKGAVTYFYNCRRKAKKVAKPA